MAIDSVFNQVQLLLGGDSGTLADESPATHSPTAVGNAASTTTRPKWGTHSLEYPDSNQTTSIIKVPHAAGLELGDGAWTIEGWLYLDALETLNNRAYYLLDKDDTFFGDTSFYIRYWAIGSPLIHRLHFVWYDQSFISISLQSGDAVTGAAWNHWAADCDGETVRLYLNGNMVDSDTKSSVGFGTATGNTHDLIVGGQNNNSTGPRNTIKTGFLDDVRITKGTARYASDTTYTVPTEAFPREGPPPNSILETITEGLNLYSLAGEFTNNVLFDTLTQSVGVSLSAGADKIAYGTFADTVRLFAYIAESKAYSAVASEAVDITPALSVLQGVTLADVVRVVLTQGTTTSYGVTAADVVRIQELLSQAAVEVLTDAIDLSEALNIALGALVVEQLGVTASLLPTTIYSRSLSDVLRLSDSLAQFFGLDLSDGLALTASVTELARLQGVLTDQVDISATATPLLLLNVVTADTLEVTASDVVNMLYSGTLSDGVELTAGYVSPGGDFTTWAMNTRTAAVSEYGNFNFNGFAQLGSRYVATGATGLYELTGDNDAGEDIIAHLKSGYMQFGGTKLSRLKAAYIATRGEEDFVLKIETGDGATYNYEVSTRNMRSTKVHMGKGQRARYFAFELTSSGGDFDLDTLEFVPVVMQRRV